jgi:arginine-tRNA-protein transferase
MSEQWRSSAWPALPPPRGVPLTVLPEHPCSYLPPRMSRTRGFVCDRLPAELYHELMDAGFRRSGRFFYQPICPGCRACQPIRVPVEKFTPSKSQRRTWRKNQDLLVTVGAAEATDEKFELYARYVRDWHSRGEDSDRKSFVEFLYDSPVETIEFQYRAAASKRLLGVGLCDVSPRSLSSVYFYFDPAESRRGIGTFSALVEIDFARRHDIPHYYLGYFIAGCGTMSYKADFQPNEILHPDGVWRAGERASKSPAHIG